MKVAITGTTGLLGSKLATKLSSEGHVIVQLGRSRNPRLSGAHFSWDPLAGEPPAPSLQEVDAVVHLLGEPVAQRWTDQAKRRIRESRVVSTRNLVRAFSTQMRRPAAFVCASATGYYGSRGDELLNEKSSPGRDFLAKVCQEWESEAELAESLGIRTVRVRTGVVLDPHQGALAKLLTPFRLGLGGPVGGGQQWMSWIHVDDAAALFAFAVSTSQLRGPVNGVAPEPVRNAGFAAALGEVLHRPAVLPTPAVALKLAFGEMATIVLSSQRVAPQAASAAGFSYQFPELRQALRDLLPVQSGSRVS